MDSSSDHRVDQRGASRLTPGTKRPERDHHIACPGQRISREENTSSAHPVPPPMRSLRGAHTSPSSNGTTGSCGGRFRNGRPRRARRHVGNHAGRGARMSSDRCQCSPRTGGCGEVFNSTTAFDMHRVGRHGVDRRCLRVPEMLSAGMDRNAGGYWVTRLMPVQARTARAGPAIGSDPLPNHPPAPKPRAVARAHGQEA